MNMFVLNSNVFISIFMFFWKRRKEGRGGEWRKKEMEGERRNYVSIVSIAQCMTMFVLDKHVLMIIIVFFLSARIYLVRDFTPVYQLLFVQSTFEHVYM